MKKKVIELRQQGLKILEICKKLGISKATVSYHLRETELRGRLDKLDSKINEILVNNLKEYYKTHTIEECMVKFNISRSTVVKYTDNKLEVMTKEERKQKNYERVKSYRQKMKERLVEYKGNECFFCGYNKCITALEFHHLDPTQKDFGISSYTNLKWDNIKKEVDKCLLVCSNCHREIHSGLRNISPLPDKELKE